MLPPGGPFALALNVAVTVRPASSVDAGVVWSVLHNHSPFGCTVVSEAGPQEWLRPWSSVAYNLAEPAVPNTLTVTPRYTVGAANSDSQLTVDWYTDNDPTPGGFPAGLVSGPGPGPVVLGAGGATGGGMTLQFAQTGRLASVFLQFITSPAVANRTVHVILNAPAGPLWVIWAPAAQAASISANYTLFVGAPQAQYGTFSAALNMALNLPGAIVGSGWTLDVGADNEQAGDVFTGMTVVLSPT